MILGDERGIFIKVVKFRVYRVLNVIIRNVVKVLAAECRENVMMSNNVMIIIGNKIELLKVLVFINVWFSVIELDKFSFSLG